MALDPEELKRRRQQRDMERAKQKERKRKLMIRLAIAAAVLILCGVLLFVLLPGGSETPREESATVQTEAAAPAETEAVPEDITTIHLAAAGDLNVTDKVVAAGGSEYEYTEMFVDVAHLLADADLAVVNLEGNLCGAPYGSGSASAPQGLAEALGDAGVDLIQLANSYSINQGISGLATTINNVRAAGMEPLGVYADQAAYKAGKGYTIRTVQGIKIAFVAFTKGMDGMALPPGSENCVNVLYTDYESTYQTIDTEGITAVLAAAAQENPDITVAMLHWGSEHNDTISKSQESIVALLQENGVDAIIGTHSHYLQKMELNEETGNFVAYSLGDFTGDCEKAGSEYSVILDLEITKDRKSGETTISGFSYTPIYTVAEGKEPQRVVRIRQAMEAYEESFLGSVSQATYDGMTYALTRIEERIAGEE